MGRTMGVGGNGVDDDGEKVTTRVITGCGVERQRVKAGGRAVSTPTPTSKSDGMIRGADVAGKVGGKVGERVKLKKKDL